VTFAEMIAIISHITNNIVNIYQSVPKERTR